VNALPQEVAQTLRARSAELAQALVELHYVREPELVSRYGPDGRARCLQDAAHHLRYLAEAVESSRPSLFVDYVTWAKIVLTGRKIPANDLKRNLENLIELLRLRLPRPLADRVTPMVAAAAEALDDSPGAVSSFLAAPQAEVPLAREYLEALLAGRRRQAAELVLGAVDRGLRMQEVYLKVFQPVLLEVGRLWQINEITVAHEHYCTAATQQVMTLLYPRIFTTPRIGRTFVSAAIGGDLHEIGSRMVADFLEMEG
jgi:hypothetical protein